MKKRMRMNSRGASLDVTTPIFLAISILMALVVSIIIFSVLQSSAIAQVLFNWSAYDGFLGGILGIVMPWLVFIFVFVIVVALLFIVLRHLKK